MVRRALDEGYDVRCLVRPRLTPADFLREWGATTVTVSGSRRQLEQSARARRGEHAEIFFTMQGDLNDPSSLPATLVGVSIVVDCATSKPEEPIKCAALQRSLQARLLSAPPRASAHHALHWLTALDHNECAAFLLAGAAVACIRRFSLAAPQEGGLGGQVRADPVRQGDGNPALRVLLH